MASFFPTSYLSFCSSRSWRSSDSIAWFWENLVKYSFSLGRFIRTLDYGNQTFFYETYANAKESFTKFVFLLILISFLFFLFGREKINHNLFKVMIFVVIIIDLYSFNSKYIRNYALKNFQWDAQITKFFRKERHH